jgi:hypothetical protein
MLGMMIIGVNPEISIWSFRDLVGIGFGGEYVVHNEGILLIELDLIWIMLDSDVGTGLGCGVFGGDEVVSFFFVIEKIEY